MTMAEMQAALIERVADPLLTVAEVAWVMGVAMTTVYNWLYARKLESIGWELAGERRRLVRESDLLAAVEAGMIVPKEAAKKC